VTRGIFPGEGRSARDLFLELQTERGRLPSKTNMMSILARDKNGGNGSTGLQGEILRGTISAGKHKELGKIYPGNRE